MRLKIRRYQIWREEEEVILRRRKRELRSKILGSAPSDLKNFVKEVEVTINDLLEHGHGKHEFHTRDLKKLGFKTFDDLVERLPDLQYAWGNEVQVEYCALGANGIFTFKIQY